MENEADLRKVRREIEDRELNMTESKLADLRHCILLDHRPLQTFDASNA